MPIFEFKRLLYTPRREFLKALAKIHSQIEYLQSLVVVRFENRIPSAAETVAEKVAEGAETYLRR
jgi:hypothetical protein